MIGETILHYRVLEKLGQGGMGVVYKAEDLRLKRVVALKFLSAGISAHPEAKARFLTEAQAASALNHPNICTIHAVEEIAELPAPAAEPAPSASQVTLDSPTKTFIPPTEDLNLTAGAASETRGLSPHPFAPPPPSSFIVMEYVKGTPLSKRIEAGPIDSSELLDLALQIAEGLREAHQHGIVHRDIKPHNLMITPTGLVKIMDFGLAKIEGSGSLSREGATVGTLAYMSPEQIQALEVDHRTDLFSFGVVLYEMVTGRRPFAAGDRGALLYSIVHDNPLAPSETGGEVSRAMERLILKCLQKDPGRRYPSCKELLAELVALKVRHTQAELAERRQAEEQARALGADRESERRQATIMFGEIVRHRDTAPPLDSDDANDAVNEVMGRLTTLAAQHGGTVDRVMSSAFTVLFGLPTAAENTPKQALRAAIEIRNAVQGTNARLAPDLRLDIHLGINTGTVLAGPVGSADQKKYSVLGDTVLLASRLKDRAPEGQICVGALTYRLTRDEFHFTPLSPVYIKGKKEPFPVFQLLAEEPAEKRAGPAAKGTVHSEMVGRERELSVLELQVLRLLDGRGGIVSVVGESGIGKSRLIAELLRGEAVKKTIRWEGRALSTGKNLSYHPIIHILKSWARIGEGDGAAEALQKLEKAIRNVHPEGLAEVFPFVATLMGLTPTGPAAERVKGIEGEARGKLILKSLRELLEKAAALQPIVFILEDLHWADLSSIELLEALFRSAQNHRVLFINVFRPNYADTSDRLLETIANRYSQFHREIPLRPLDENQANLLIEKLLDVKGLPLSVRERILKRAEGNPLFIEEVVRSFIDEGAVEAWGGSFRVTDKIDSVVIPETIQELLLARIDLLDEDTRALIKVAAVMGRSFLHRVLALVAPAPGSIERSLEHLIQVQLIRKAERMGEVEYLFWHPLVQESSYECIPPRKRKELHLQVASAIESSYPERLSQFYGMLALHYSRGENPEKAEEYLLKAGEEAVKAAAPSEALYYYQEALRIYLKQYGEKGDPDRMAQLERNIALAFHNKGRMVEAVEHFDKALAYWGAGPPRGPLGKAARLVGDLLSVLRRLYLPGRPPKRVPSARDNEIIAAMSQKGTAIVSVDAKRYFVESIGTMRMINRFDIQRVANGVAVYAAASTLFSIPPVSFRISRRILDYTRPLIQGQDARTILYHRFAELLHNLLAGNWGEVGRYEEALVESNLSLGEAWYVSVYTVCHALIAIERGDYKEGRRLVQKLEELGEVYENDLIRGRKHLLHTRLLLKQRRLPEARREAEAGVPVLSKIDHELLLIYMLGLKANVHVLLEELEPAEETLEQAKNLIARKGRVPPYYISSYFIGRFQLDLHRLEEARSRHDDSSLAKLGRKALESGRSAVRIARRNASDRTEAFRLMGIYHWLGGRPQEATAWWHRGRREGERLGAAPEVARIDMELGRRLLESKSLAGEASVVRAHEALRRARVVFQEKGLTSDLGELDRTAPRARVGRPS